jgi:hypothetical protein
MIISHKHKFIYFKTRKTASSSLEIAISKFCGQEDVITPILEGGEEIRKSLGYPGPQNFRLPPCAEGSDFTTLKNHTKAHEIKKLMPKVFSEYYKFTFERNPFDKAVSRYYWELARQNSNIPLDQFFERAPEWMLTNWPIYAENDGVIVDFVGRYEEMEVGLNIISEKLNLPERISLPKERAKSSSRSDRRSYREVLTESARTRIGIICKREIELFNYKW